MDPSTSIDALNQLLQILSRSLPVYVHGFRPWARRNELAAVELLDRIAADHHRFARRIGEAIIDKGGRPDLGSFPMEFTAIHDVGADYLVGLVLARYRSELVVIEQAVTDLANDLDLQPIAVEILRDAREHLAKLEQATANG